MPFGLPAHLDTPENNSKMEHCVERVMKQGKDKSSAVAICKASIMGKGGRNMAEWTTAYVNSLPDSSFAYIDPQGGRHLPYKDKNGKVDLPHVRNALARLNQVKGMPSSTQARVRAKLEALLPQNKSERYYVQSAEKALSDATQRDDLKWIQAFPYNEWEYEGEKIVFNKERADNMVKNFADGIRVLGEDDLCIDYDHKADPAKGGKAAGWIKAMEARDDGLYVGAEFTPQAITEIDSKEWKYLSPSYYDEFDGVADVMKGLALTNQPVLRDIKPINFSEIESLEKEVSDNMPDDDKKVKELSESVKKLSERNAAFLNALGLTDDASDEDVIKKIETTVATAATVEKAMSEADRVKELSEKFPDVAKRLTELESKSRNDEAKSFSESYLRHKNKGIAPVTVVKIADLHKELSERGISPAPLKAILDGIMENGLVDFNEKGSSGGGGGETAENPQAATIELSEKMAEKMREGKTSQEALALVSAEHPDLWKLYNGGGE